MHIRLYLLITALIISSGFISQKKANPEITAAELKKHVEYLASDHLEGRKPGTTGDKLAAEYIREQFSKYGLKLLGNNGFQDVEIVAGVEMGSSNYISIQNKRYQFPDIIPLSFSSNNALTADVVFAGYGFEIESDQLSWNDYKDINVKDKWVLIFKGEPKQQGRSNPFETFSSVRTKVLTATDRGAAGVLFVNPASESKNDDLTELYYDKVESTAGVPVIHIKRSIADYILASKNTTIENLEIEINTSKKPHSIESGTIVGGSAEVRLKKVNSRNIIGMVEGKDPLLKNEFIVIGAHYDHLGMGGHGSGSRFPDTTVIHNGADDNASGVAGVIELAGKLNNLKKQPARSIVFIAFTGEEMGLLGSKKFVESQLIPVKNIKAMINFDMIGRLKRETNSLLTGGSGTALELDSLLNLYASKHSFKLGKSPEGLGPSDHAAFYAQNIPVIFISTGPHSDYHTWADDVEKLDFEGEKQVLEFTFDLVKVLMNGIQPITFKEAGPKSRSEGASYKVTLGIMPDFAAGSIKGLRVEAVSEGGPAMQGGMKNGDIIVAINGLPVTNIYDYMNRLKKLEKGETISVDVLRNDLKEVLIIQL